MNITIQKATLNEIERLQKIGRETFSGTFSSSNTEENMKQYLAEGFSYKKLTDQLNNENSEFYFALSERNSSLSGIVSSLFSFIYIT